MLIIRYFCILSKTAAQGAGSKMRMSDKINAYYSRISKTVNLNEYQFIHLNFLKNNNITFKNNKNFIHNAVSNDLISKEQASFLFKANLNSSYHAMHIFSTFQHKWYPTKLILVTHTSDDTLPQTAKDTEFINKIQLNNGTFGYLGSPLHMQYNSVEQLNSEIVGPLYYSDDINKIQAKGILKQYSDINKNITSEYKEKVHNYLLGLTDKKGLLKALDYNRIYWELQEGLYKDVVHDDDNYFGFDIVHNIKKIKNGLDEE